MGETIRFLSDECIDQIAAGEVIERPASVVKELIENSLDAGADRIDVFIRDGGKNSIRISDNGSGIPPAEAERALQRHATSKIIAPEDLFGVETNGFRGEALPSIASVSRLTLISRHLSHPIAVELRSEPGELLVKTETARDPGTTVQVDQLFCNAPVRARFLGSATTEGGRILEMTERIALARPEVAFRVISDGKELLSTRPGTLRSRIEEVLAPSLAENMHPVEWEENGIRIAGFIGDEKTHRARRQHQYFYLDRRPIWNAALFRAVSQASEALHGHPAAVLFFSVPPDEVDVNVHPAKREVRFAKESELFGAVVRAIRSAWAESAGWSPKEHPTEQQSTLPSDWSHTEWKARETVSHHHSAARDLFADDPTGTKLIRWHQPTEESRETEHPETPSPSPDRPLFQVGSQYIAAEAADGLLFIDQSAAHRRVLYDKARQRLQHGDAPSQQLMFPELIELTPSQHLWMEQSVPLLKKLGFEAEPFGTRSWQVRGIPADFQTGNSGEVIRAMADDAAAEGERQSDPTEALYLSYARQCAIPSIRSLSKEEMIRLIDDLFMSDNPYVAPDGATIVQKLSLDRIDQFFKKGKLS